MRNNVHGSEKQGDMITSYLFSSLKEKYAILLYVACYTDVVWRKPFKLAATSASRMHLTATRPFGWFRIDPTVIRTNGKRNEAE